MDNGISNSNYGHPEIINGTIDCPLCQRTFFASAKSCTSCGWLNHYENDIEENQEPPNYIENARESGDWANVPLAVIQKEAEGIVLTTSFFLANKDIDREIEVISAECVYGMNIFRDIFAGFTDFFGGRSVATQKVLRDARRTALGELRREALILGADAVIGIDLDYQELSGGGKNGMMMLVASGTAVSVKK